MNEFKPLLQYSDLTITWKKGYHSENTDREMTEVYI